MRKFKIKIAKPQGRLYRLEILASQTDQRGDDLYPPKGSVMITTNGSIYFGKLYPVKEKPETKEPTKAQNAPNRYTRYDYDLERYVVPLLYKANGDTISFNINKGGLEYADHGNGQRTVIGGTPDIVYGEVIDRLAELENKEERTKT